MKLMKNIIVTVMVLSLLTVLFVGCQSEKEVDTNDKVASDNNDAEASDESSDEVVEIEFFQQKVEAVDTYNVLIEKFESENPNIKVVQNNVPDPGSVLMARVASGATPDVFLDYPNAVEFRIRAEEEFMYDFTGEDFLGNVKEGVLDGIAIDGKNFSLPLSVNTIGIYYNTKIFAELGLEAPKDFAEFEVVLATLKDAGYTPLALADKESWTVGITMNQMSGTEIENSAEFYATLEDGSGDATQSAELRLMAERIVALRAFGAEDALAAGYGDAINLFSNGEAVMLVQGIWAKPSIEKANPDIEFSMFPFPATKAENSRVIFGIDSAISMSSDSDHPEAALKFMSFLAETENAQLFADMDNSPSTIKGVTTNVEEFKLLIDLLDAGKSFEWHHFKWGAGMEGQFNDTVQELVVTKDVDAYLENLNSIFLNSNQ